MSKTIEQNDRAKRSSKTIERNLKVKTIRRNTNLTMTNPVKTGSAFEELMSVRQSGLADDVIEITGQDPVLPTRFTLGESSAAVHIAIGIAVNDVWEIRSGRRQALHLDVTHAAATLKSYEYFTEKGTSAALAGAGRNRHAAMSWPHPTRDDRYFLPHMGLPHLAARILGILKCENELDAVKQAVARWNALELEDAVAEARACGAMVRSADEWLSHPHGKLLSEQPVIEISKIAESEPEGLGSNGNGDLRPLDGCRVLDLTRILAGPTCARTLAEHGADVLMVTAEHLPQAERFVKDTSHGKRSCFLDLTLPDERDSFVKLLDNADACAPKPAIAVLTIDRTGRQ